MSHQLAARASERGNSLSEQRFADRAAEATHAADVVRKLLQELVIANPVQDLDEEDQPGKEERSGRL